MESRKIVILMVLLTALLLPLALGVSAQVEEENVWEYEGEYEDYIAVKVTTPAQAYPGDKITIKVRVVAQVDLDDVLVDARVLGTKKNGTESWESAWEYDVIDVSTLDEGDREDGDCDVTIPKDVDPGLICGYISCEFVDRTTGDSYFFYSGFPITYLLNKNYENLQKDYAKLQADYAKLQANYTDISSKYNTLQTSYNSLKSEHDTLVTDYDAIQKKYTSLKSNYDSLNATYNSLKSSYDSLDSEHKKLRAEYDDLESRYEATAGELNNYRTYTYALAVATIIFVVTTIIFAVRKPKTL